MKSEFGHLICLKEKPHAKHCDKHNINLTHFSVLLFVFSLIFLKNFNMRVLRFIYEIIKVYFINRKGKSNHFSHLEKHCNYKHVVPLHVSQQSLNVCLASFQVPVTGIAVCTNDVMCWQLWS